MDSANLIIVFHFGRPRGQLMSNTTHAELQGKPLNIIRQAIRQGRYNGQTSGLGLHELQGNLAILPVDLAFDFLRFCNRNPKPCPLLAMSEPGDPSLPGLGEELDVRYDVPSYNVYEHGELTGRVDDLQALWREDLVAFVLGCSFSFETALVGAGIPMRHIERNRNVAMYRSSLQTEPAGVFHGPMVVSMRPMSAADAIRAVTITARFPHAHGTPVHLGDPARIGIDDLDRPDWGEPMEIRDGEIPVFWACGVTPQEVIRHARPPLCITHTPGCMLVCDLPGDRAPQQ